MKIGEEKMPQELKDRLREHLQNYHPNQTFTAADLKIDGPLTLAGVKHYTTEQIQGALEELAKARFLTEARLERRRGATSYRVMRAPS